MIIDLILIGIIILFTFLGYYRGLIKVGVKILGFVISLVVALVLYTPISNYIIENTNVEKDLESVIQQRLYDQEQSGESQEQTDNIFENLGKYVEDYADDVKENSSEYIAETLAVIVVRIGTWIGLFLVTRILMIFLKVLGSIVEKIPIIKQFNKLGGTIYGVLEGILIIYIGLAIISFISPMMESTHMVDKINDTHICKSMYDNNIILKMIL